MFCTNCGKEIDDKAVVCIHCGCAVNGNNTLNNPSEKKWLVALLLCLFLGTIGIHRFYVGKIGSGVVMLLLTCSCIGFPISAVWALIDFILICTDSFKTSTGQNLQK